MLSVGCRLAKRMAAIFILDFVLESLEYYYV